MFLKIPDGKRCGSVVRDGLPSLLKLSWVGCWCHLERCVGVCHHVWVSLKFVHMFFLNWLVLSSKCLDNAGFKQLFINVSYATACIIICFFFFLKCASFFFYFQYVTSNKKLVLEEIRNEIPDWQLWLKISAACLYITKLSDKRC